MIIKKSFFLLEEYVDKENYKGWDPYDGLNSKLFQKIPIVNKNKFIRLCWIQFFKRNPINLRKIFLIKKEYNPKGLALFLSGYCNLYHIEKKNEYIKKIRLLTQLLINCRSEGWSGSCWGYNFDWQARAFYFPKFTPTVVVTSYAGYALLDAYDILRDDRLLKLAISSCNFILKDLNRTYDQDGNFIFSYSPLDKTQVFNASLLGAKLLSRVYYYNKDKKLIENAKKAINYCIKFQNKDGSWPYSTFSFHQWIDSFHTGYNIECIAEYQKYSGDNSFKKNIKIGLDYYLNNFFTTEGIPKYYNVKMYPIDIHSTSQLIITLYRLNLLKEKKELINKVLGWTIKNMQDKKGYFYYQKLKWYKNKIPYIRWSQGWMFLALSYYLREFNNE